MATIADLVIRLSGDTRNLGRDLNQAEGGLSRLAGKGVIAGTVITAAATAGIASIVKLGNSYANSLNTFQSVTRANAATMDQVGDKAKELGNDLSIPGASAKDAAEAMTELAKGGLS